jgi:hypothetical protein
MGDVLRKPRYSRCRALIDCEKQVSRLPISLPYERSFLNGMMQLVISLSLSVYLSRAILLTLSGLFGDAADDDEHARALEEQWMEGLTNHNDSPLECKSKKRERKNCSLPCAF